MKLFVTAMPDSMMECPFSSSEGYCKAGIKKNDELYPELCCAFTDSGEYRDGGCEHLMVLPIRNERYLSSLNDPDLENRYALLDRMRSDCNYFLFQKELGLVDESVLWAKSVAGQIAIMKVLWESFPADSKPEWLTWDVILHFEQEMSAALGKSGAGA